ncbi:MAG: FecR family protein [Pseudomonadota bacterium]
MRRFAPRGRRARLLIAAAALSLAGAGIAAGAPQVIGINSAVLNNVRIRSAGAATAHTAVVRQRVALADEVQTGGRSQLQVLLLDKSVFTVGANARLTIDRYVYDPDRGTRAMGASVVKGAFRFMSGRPDARGSSAIRTPVATIGIRGTILDGVVGEEAVRIAAGEPGVGPNVRSDPATASLVVLRGPGRSAQGRVVPGVIDVTAGNRTVTIDRPMRAVYVPRPGAAPIGPFVLSPRGLLQLQALIFPSLAPRFGFAPEQAGLPAYPGETNPPRGRIFPPGGYPGESGPPARPGSYVPAIPQGTFDQPGGRQRPPSDAASAPNTMTAPPAPQSVSAPTPTPTPVPSPTPGANGKP